MEREEEGHDEFKILSGGFFFAFVLLQGQARGRESKRINIWMFVLLFMLPQGLNAPSQAMKLLGLKECLLRMWFACASAEERLFLCSVVTLLSE